MREKGHEFFIYARDKDVTHELLEIYGLDFVSRGKGKDSPAGKFLYLIFTVLRFVWPVTRFGPDIFLSRASPYNSLIAFLLGKPGIIIDDTEINRFTKMVYKPLASAVITCEHFGLDMGKKQVRVRSFEPLAYLHPGYFRPDKSVLKELGTESGEQYFILRLVAGRSLHGGRKSALPGKTAEKIVEILQKHGKVFVSADFPPVGTLKKHALFLSPDRIHHVLYFARMVAGNSATVAAEAAVCGTPSVYIGRDTRGYIDKLEKEYGLVTRLVPDPREPEKTVRELEKTIENLPPAETALQKRDKLLSSSTDYTEFLVRAIENLPASA